MSKEKFLTVVAMAETYRQNLSEVAVKLYVQGLNGLTDEQVKSGVGLAIQTLKFMPSCSELRELSGGGVKTLKQEADIAFAELDAALCAGSSKGLDDYTKGIMRAMGGFTYLNALPAKELRSFARQQFINLYEGTSKPLPAIEGPKHKHERLGGVNRLQVTGPKQ